MDPILLGETLAVLMFVGVLGTLLAASIFRSSSVFWSRDWRCTASAALSGNQSTRGR